MDEAFDQAVEALKAGRAVVFPTDTVYGLGVAPRFAHSPQEIFDLKRRPAGKPVAWLVGSLEDLDKYGTAVTPKARALAEEGWPGALTVIVKASDEVPRAFQSDAGTIGLRMPDSQTALALIREVGPIAASSANLSGHPVPRTFSEIAPELLSGVGAAIVSEDAGSGKASTVIEAAGDVVTVLRS